MQLSLPPIQLTLCTLVLLLYAQTGIATTPEQLQREIDQQLWKPFVAAYENMDGEAFNALYADQVLRVTPAGIDTRGAFKQQNLERFAARKAAGTQIELDFWFEHRHTDTDTSYEVGYFRIHSVTEEQQSTFYGQFHIVVEKLDGQWLITQDWDHDTVKGDKVNSNDFSKGKPIVFD